MVYPDGEKISYRYNKVGQLRSMSTNMYGDNDEDSIFIAHMGYDVQERCIYKKMGDGSETYNTFDGRDRLENLKIDVDENNKLDNTYYFDAINNIEKIENEASTNPYTYEYTYDDINRLVGSSGSGGVNIPSYYLEMEYDKMGNPTLKNQIVTGDLDLSYNYEYLYNTEDHPNAPSSVGGNNFNYDANGNVTKIEGSDTSDTLTWDEENRLKEVTTNGKIAKYVYDHKGERVLKLSGAAQTSVEDGAVQGTASQNDEEYTAYISPYFVLTQDKGFTKYYYTGAKRVIGKLGVGHFENQYSEQGISAGDIDYAERFKELQEEENEQEGDQPLSWPTDPEQNPAADADAISPESETSTVHECGAGYTNEDNSEETEVLYFFHSDHLGSTAFVCDKDGAQQQFVAYLPFGETMYEERSIEQAYKFNGKELDDDTGLYYYGARYYNPKIGLWYGVDPLAEKYTSTSPFVYCMNNPVMYVDPDGRKVDLSNMSEAGREYYESLIAGERESSELFDAMYSLLESSEEVVTVQFGETIVVEGDQVSGQSKFNEDGSSEITYLEGREIPSACLTEESFHSLQNIYKNNYDVGTSNTEFEAKVFTIAVSTENDSGSGQYQGMNTICMEILCGNYGDDNQPIKSSTVQSKSFVDKYISSANKYANFNKINKKGNKNYKTSTTVPPYLLQKIIKTAYEK